MVDFVVDLQKSLVEFGVKYPDTIVPGYVPKRIGLLCSYIYN